MGHVQADEMVIDVPLLRYTLANGERRVKVAHLNEQKAGEYAKASLTKIKTLLRFKKMVVPSVWFLPCLPRDAHQIRVHMAHIGHALLGDDKYQNNPLAPKVGRLCLHAWQLGMTNDDGHTVTRPQNFVAPVADDMAQLFAKNGRVVTQNSIKLT